MRTSQDLSTVALWYGRGELPCLGCPAGGETSTGRLMPGELPAGALPWRGSAENSAPSGAGAPGWRLCGEVRG